MKMLSLFSGIGGLDLAAHWAGIETVAFCEIDPYCRSILAKHWPGVPIFTDIKTLNKEALNNAGVKSIDIICGGFPCQPFSIAGKQKGKSDSRYLWEEMHRVIEEIKPAWVIGENVENSVRIVLDDIIDSMERIEYKTRTFVISAYCSGAYFDGKRIFIVAAPNYRSAAVWRDTQFSSDGKTIECGSDNRRRTPESNTGERREIESRPYGVAVGVSNRVDRIRALGNAVRPQQAYPIFAAIMEVENAYRTD